MSYQNYSISRIANLSAGKKKAVSRALKTNVRKDIKKKQIKGQFFKKLAGDAGIFQTVAIMVKEKIMSRKKPLIRVLTMKIIKGTGRDKRKQAEKIYDYIVKKIAYVSDIIEVETLQTPEVTLILGAGDCDDHALIVATMLESIGIPSKYVLASYRDDKQYQHVYCQIDISGKKYILDTAYGKGFNIERPGYTRRQAV